MMIDTSLDEIQEPHKQDIQNAINQLLSSELTLSRIIQISVCTIFTITCSLIPETQSLTTLSLPSSNIVCAIQALPDPPPAFEPICDSTTLEECRKVRSACPYVSWCCDFLLQERTGGNTDGGV
jgi:hypothetical protein